MDFDNFCHALRNSTDSDSCHSFVNNYSSSAEKALEPILALRCDKKTSLSVIETCIYRKNFEILVILLDELCTHFKTEQTVPNSTNLPLSILFTPLEHAVTIKWSEGVDLILEKLGTIYQSEDLSDQKSQLMIKACQSHCVDSKIIKTLFEFGFRVICPFEHPVFRSDPKGENLSWTKKRRAKEARCTDYHYIKLGQLTARANPTYMILEYVEDKLYYNPEDLTIYGNCIAVIREIRWHQAKRTSLFNEEFKKLVLQLEKLMLDITSLTKNDEELSHLLHLNLNMVRDEDRQASLFKKILTF